MWVGFGLASLVLAASVTASTRPDDRVSAELRWRVEDEECISSEELATAVEERLGRSLFGARSPDVVVEGHIERDPEVGWIASLELRSADGRLIGTRELATDAEHCDSLDASVALSLAIMVDLPKEKVRLRVPKEPVRPEPWLVGGETTAVGQIGALPKPGVGLRVAAIAGPRRLGFMLDGTYFLDREGREGDAVADFGLAYIGLHVCPQLIGNPMTGLNVCFGQEIGRITAAGKTLDVNRDRTELVLAVRAGARGTLRLVGPIVGSAGLSAGVPLVRDEFTFTDTDGTEQVVFQTFPVNVALDVGIGLRFE